MKCSITCILLQNIVRVIKKEDEMDETCSKDGNIREREKESPFDVEDNIIMNIRPTGPSTHWVGDWVGPRA
jgi:hypothetical protein